MVDSKTRANERALWKSAMDKVCASRIVGQSKSIRLILAL